MLTIHTKQELKLWRNQHQNFSIGLVPTMGALHEGHLALVEEAKKGMQLVVVSIFVNPLQFNNATDFEKYPQTLEADVALLQGAGAHVVFAPNASEIYKGSIELTLEFGTLNNIMEGAKRPGHFNGVGLIVAKLFNLVQPNQAFFGLKDLQQVRIIQQLITHLDFQVELVACPTIREQNGLALSSRNSRLTPNQRSGAFIIFKTLSDIATDIKNGIPIIQAIDKGKSVFDNSKELIIKTEYLEVVDALTLEIVSEIENNPELAVCIACYIGEVRLIDNLIFSV